LVQRIYQRGVSDEAVVLERWGYAGEEKRRTVAELGFPSSSEKSLRQPGSRDRDSAYSEEQIKRIAAAHRAVIKKRLPSLAAYRPSQLAIATLQKCWEPYAKLLLESAKSLAGADFGDMKAGLIENGFDPTVLDLDCFRENQTKKYFLQQTSASIARRIVIERHPKRIGIEDAVRTAEKRIYGRTRRK